MASNVTVHVLEVDGHPMVQKARRCRLRLVMGSVFSRRTSPVCLQGRLAVRVEDLSHTMKPRLTTRLRSRFY